MAYGDGSITEVRRGVWRVRVDFGKDPVTGKRQVVSRNVKGTKRDAAKMRDRIRREHENGLTAEGEKTTFGKFADEWHAARVMSGSLTRTFLDREKTTIDMLKGYIGNVRLRDITPKMVETLYQTILRDKLAERGKYSGTTMHMHHAKLKQILEKAVKFDLIARNPCDRVEPPKADDAERRSLHPDEASRLLACADAEFESDLKALEEKEGRQDAWNVADGRTRMLGLSQLGYSIAVRLALATGMRRGEVFGLTWECVDLSAQTVSVVQSLTAHGETKKPKTRAGFRTIYIDADTAHCLECWRRTQEDMLARLSLDQAEATPVCCSSVGGYAELHSFSRWWCAFREKHGFPGLKFHELRHTQATQLLANGVDVKTVQTRMGHSSASLTLDWYAHAVPENDKKAARIIGNLLSTDAEERGRIIKLKTA